LRFIPGGDSVAFVCSEGTVGTWNFATGETVARAHVEGHAHTLETSADGESIVAGSDNGLVTVVDLVTDVAHTYPGHGVRIAAITPPGREFPFILSADVRGHIRAWPLPPRRALPGGIRPRARRPNADRDHRTMPFALDTAIEHGERDTP
jgi:hypothetical protein